MKASKLKEKIKELNDKSNDVNWMFEKIIEHHDKVLDDTFIFEMTAPNPSQIKILEDLGYRVTIISERYLGGHFVELSWKHI